MTSAERSTRAETSHLVDGPYETENDASARVSDIYAAFHKHGVMQARTFDRLVEVCERTEVRLGGYDRHILKWLAGQKPEVAQVVIGIVSRASAHDGPPTR